MAAFNELYALPESTHKLFTALTWEERMFVYYLFRASLPFNLIARDQNHRFNNEIIAMFSQLYQNKDRIDANLANDIGIYLVHLWANHGIYSLKEHHDNKKTPAKLGLKYLTVDALSKLTDKTHLFPTIFDPAVDSTLVVDGSIDKSGANYYGPGLTQAQYERFPEDVKRKINAYFELDSEGVPCYTDYSVKYRKELGVASVWLERALVLVERYPARFDIHIEKSLRYLIHYFVTGDEEAFRKHSIEWLKTKSRIDYTMGFIETYDDPMGIRGQAAAEVTIKTVDMEKLGPVLLEIEKRLPIPNEYQKGNGVKTIMNVSMNKILFAAGHLGPLKSVAAYCLPNYNDIRSEHGSKQIIYAQDPSLAETLYPELAKQFHSTRKQAFIDKYDPENKISEDLWEVQVILHETIGHASGKLYKHTFVEGENTMIGGKTYKVGENLDVTDNNIAEFLPVDLSALEELRAEINALYISMAEINILDNNGLFKNWVKILGEIELRKQCVIEMARHMFRRYLSQNDNMTTIQGAHARANVVITNFLLEGGGIEIVEEIKVIDAQPYHLLEIQVIDLDKAYNSVITLLRIVQQIKSTGDTLECQKLFNKYTTFPVNLDQARQYKKYMDDIQKKLMGNIKGVVRVYPNYIVNSIGPSMNIFEQNILYDKIALSTEI